MGSLVSLANLIPIFLQVITCIFIQVAALFYLTNQNWYRPLPDKGIGETVVCWENSVLYNVSCFQYIILAFVYSKGKPYRQRVITNFWFLLSALSLTVFQVYLLVYPSKYILEFFEIKDMPNEFRYILLLFPLSHFLLAVFIEVCLKNVLVFHTHLNYFFQQVIIADQVWLKKVIRFVTRKRFPKNKYKMVLKDNDFYSWLNEESNILRRPSNYAVRN